MHALLTKAARSDQKFDRVALTRKFVWNDDGTRIRVRLGIDFLLAFDHRAPSAERRLKWVAGSKLPAGFLSLSLSLSLSPGFFLSAAFPTVTRLTSCLSRSHVNSWLSRAINQVHSHRARVCRLGSESLVKFIVATDASSPSLWSLDGSLVSKGKRKKTSKISRAANTSARQRSFPTLFPTLGENAFRLSGRLIPRFFFFRF